jgi:hypothetical protein
MAKTAAKRKAASSTRKRSTKTATRRKASATRRAATKSTSRAAARKATRKATRKKTAPRAKSKTALGRKKSAAARNRAKSSAPTRSRTSARASSGRKKTARPTPPAARKRAPREGGTGRERDLAQTPETGRSVKGPTNPFPTRRSTGTAAGAGGTRQAPGLERARRHLREVDETVPSPPSSLTLDRRPSAARTGRQEMREARRDHTEVGPEITGGDVDADWASAYDVGDEAPGGDNPTPDQDRVDDIGKALGVEYEDNEELKASDKIAERDKKRWELDPASSDDYQDRD